MTDSDDLEREAIQAADGFTPTKRGNGKRSSADVLKSKSAKDLRDAAASAKPVNLEHEKIVRLGPPLPPRFVHDSRPVAPSTTIGVSHVRQSSYFARLTTSWQTLRPTLTSCIADSKQ